MRSVAVVTSSRADYGTCRPIMRALEADEQLELRVLVTGSHLSQAWGYTVSEIEADGFVPDERIDGGVGASAEDAGRSLGLVAQGFAEAFARNRPDLALFVGDRLELLGVAGAALPFRIPLAHVSGGDVTGGAIDDLVRNALSKLAHLHFVAMPEHSDRLVAMGEERWRITVSGDPALDDVVGPWPEREALERELGSRLEPPVVVVGFHPATLGSQTPGQETDALLAALEQAAGTLVFTYPGADTGADEVIARIEAFTARRPNTILHRNLGQQRYYTLLAHADLLVGNTSSGIWEAPSFRLPVVNVGDRQRGRRRAANVVDAPAEAEAIAAAIARTLEPGFRRSLDGLVNPYGDGRATERILAVLREAEPARLLAKSAEPGS